MKRLFLTGIATLGFFAVSTATFAQVQVGLRGGAHWGTVSKPEVFESMIPTFRLSPGPTGALFLEVPVSERVSIRPEIAYVQKGFMLRESYNLNLGGFNLPLGARVAYQAQNIEVPLLAKVNLSDGPVKPYLFAGPAVSYMADSRVQARGTALFRTKPINLDADFGGWMNKWDFSGIAGAGVSVDAGAGKFFAEARYEHGFTRQIQVPVVNLPVRNRGVNVSLGYSFPIGQ
ncbi:hypothetical protein GCM10023189_05580 [Nibrella saemangeumensis]|uniref:Outer membrane protein beta-barrel domain-containing protein n=1 Tax=Nibrella saemangeumensis TaxID=1084526 RepID=A0ABP8ME19_9BACT